MQRSCLTTWKEWSHSRDFVDWGTERQRASGYAQNFSEFQAKLRSLGFESLEHLHALGSLEVCLFDHCVDADMTQTCSSQISTDVPLPQETIASLTVAGLCEGIQALAEIPRTGIGETPSSSLDAFGVTSNTPESLVATSDHIFHGIRLSCTVS